jgi:flagellar protein FlgJ
MTAPIPTGPRGAPSAAAGDTDRRLRETARQLEGVFVSKLFEAMRATVPEGGLVDGGAGEQMFRALMDEHVAADTPAQWGSHGLAEALLRQLRAGAAAPAPEPPALPDR